MSLMGSTASHSSPFGEETSFFCLGQGWRLTICLAFQSDKQLGNPQLCLLTFSYFLFSALHLSSKVCYSLCSLPFQASYSKQAASCSVLCQHLTVLLSCFLKLINSFPVVGNPSSLFLIVCFLFKKVFLYSFLMRSQERRQDYEFNQSSHN